MNHMPIYKVKAQRLIKHFAIVSANDKEEAIAKYIAEEWAWDEVVSDDLLKASIYIELDTGKKQSI